MSRNGRAFLIISVFVIFSDGLFIFLNYHSAEQAMEQGLLDELTESQASFELKLDSTMENMRQISAFVASDERVRDLFRQGRDAVLAEGGGAGGTKAARLRQELLDLVGPGWQRMGEDFSVRQLHFHLGPGSLSYLRVHKPTKFGDRMDDVRYTVVTANAAHRPTSGFETGRVYSGIRGVSPISAINPETGASTHVGVVEAGLAFADMLNSLHAHSGAGYSVLLHDEHLARNVWPEFLDRMYEQRPPVNRFYIEASTSIEDTRKIVERISMTSSEPMMNLRRFKLDNRTIAAFSFSLRDFAGNEDPAAPDAGLVLVWVDASERQALFEKTILTNVVLALVAFLFLELILYLVIGWVTKKLQSAIDRKTHQLAITNNELSESLEKLKEAECHLVHSEKMASIGQFAAGIAHEINTPIGYLKSNLQSFQGYWNTLAKKAECCGGKSSKDDGDIAFVMEDTEALMDESRQGIEHIQRIVLDLRNFVRHGRNELSESDLNEGLETTLRIVRGEIPNRIRIEKKLGDLPLVECAAHQINQVFLNVLMNAIQAIEGEGVIQICSSVDSDQVVFSISDTGAGIDPDKIHNIFEPFFTTKDVGSGTGLGLSISYGIVQRHNGSIEVESTLGKGSRFWIRLPICQVRETENTTVGG